MALIGPSLLWLQVLLSLSSAHYRLCMLSLLRSSAVNVSQRNCTGLKILLQDVIPIVSHLSC